MKPDSPIETAKSAWGTALPEWVETMAKRCAELSQKRVAQRIGYSAAVVSNVLHAKYLGDLSRVQTAFEGAFCASTVACPAIGAIPSNACLTYQRQPMRTSNPRAMRIWNACRSGCPHYRKEPMHAE